MMMEPVLNHMADVLGLSAATLFFLSGCISGVGTVVLIPLVKERLGAWVRRRSSLQATVDNKRQAALIDIFLSAVKYEEGFGRVVLNGSWPRNDTVLRARQTELIMKGRKFMQEARMEMEEKSATYGLLIGNVRELALTYCNVIDQLDDRVSELLWSPQLEQRLDDVVAGWKGAGGFPSLEQMSAYGTRCYEAQVEVQELAKKLLKLRKLIGKHVPLPPPFALPKNLRAPSASYESVFGPLSIERVSEGVERGEEEQRVVGRPRHL